MNRPSEKSSSRKKFIATAQKNTPPPRKLLVVGLHTSNNLHNQLQRCANSLDLQYVRANDKQAFAKILRVEQQIVLFTADYERDQAGLRTATLLGRIAVEKQVAIIYIGANLRRTDVLNIFRAGGRNILQRPFLSDDFIEKAENLIKPLLQNKLTEETHDTNALNFPPDATPAEKAAMLASKVETALAFPYAVSKIMEVSRKPNVDNREILPIINSDSAICAAIIRRANSVYYFGAKKITTIVDALVRLGLNELRNVISLMGLYDLFDKNEKTFGFNRYMFWQHALSTALIAEQLAAVCNREELMGDAFLAGLLHDIGKLTLDEYLRPDFRRALQEAADRRRDMATCERDRFMLDHATLGGQLCFNWKIPEIICRVITDHHTWKEQRANTDKAALSRFVHVANSLSKVIGAGHGGNFLTEFLHDEDWPLELSTIGEAQNFYRAIYDNLNDFVDLLQIPRQNICLPAPPTSQKSGKKVLISRSGLSKLLEFYCHTRGHAVEITSSSKALADTAANLRVVESNMYDDDELIEQIVANQAHTRPLIILRDKPLDEGPETIRVLTPARDLFALEDALNQLLTGKAAGK